MTPNVLVSLEALRAAFRGMRLERAGPGRSGNLVPRPEPVHFNAPCRLERMGDPPQERVTLDRFGDHCPVEAIRETMQVHMGEPITVIREIALPHRAEDCPICREIAPSYRILPNYLVGVALAPSVDGVVPVALSSLWPMIVGSSWPAGERPPAVSYTGGENGALEAIRLAGERPNEGLAAQYRPVEGPTATCSACPALVAPEELWVGKKSGIALCEPCMTKWEKAGRARRTGEF